MWRRARDVEHREREPLGHVTRELRVRAAREEHRFPLDVELRARATHVAHAIDPQRRERERHERSHAIANSDTLPLGSPRREAQHTPEQHPARTRHRIVLLAPRADGLFDHTSDSLVATARRLHLDEARGVDVERLDGEEHLALEEARKVVVDPLRRLRERALRIERAVGAPRIAAAINGSRLGSG